MECPRCEGSGKCTDCAGQGFIVCLACEGTGETTSSRGATYPCRSCKGSGRIECTLHCVSCEGTGQITPALQEKVREKYHVRWDNQLPLYRFTNVVVLLCIVVFLIQQVNPVASGWIQGYLSNLSGFWHQPWRLLTSAFLHAGWWHLLFNMTTLLRYGPYLEGLYGSLRFALLWAVCAIGGSALSSWAHFHLHQQVVMSVGASGALFGFFGCIFGLHQRYSLFERRQVMHALLWLAVSTLLLPALVPDVDNWAHAGGFLTGFAYVWLTRRPVGR